MKNVTSQEFLAQFLNMRKPGGRVPEFLKSHRDATGRASTMSVLAKDVGYRHYKAMNLQYGRLAERIARALGCPTQPGHVAMELLVEFVAPKGRSARHLSNDEYIVIMRPEFATALVAAGWIPEVKGA